MLPLVIFGRPAARTAAAPATTPSTTPESVFFADAFALVDVVVAVDDLPNEVDDAALVVVAAAVDGPLLLPMPLLELATLRIGNRSSDSLPDTRYLSSSRSILRSR